MSDMTALAQKLQALISTDDVFEEGGRVISDLGVPSPLFGMLREVDETVLERSLVFTSGTSSLTVIAAGRRLRGITSVTGNDPQTSNVIGQAISREDPDTLDMARAVMSDIFDPDDLVTVQALPAQPFGGSGERGVPAADLIDLWGVAASEDAVEVTGTPLERFLKTTAASSTGMLHISGEDVVGSDGETRALETIWEDQATDFLDAQAKLLKASEPQKIMSLNGVLSDDQSVSMIVDADEIVLLAHDPAQLGKLHRAWHKIFG